MTENPTFWLNRDGNPEKIPFFAAFHGKTGRKWANDQKIMTDFPHSFVCSAQKRAVSQGGKGSVDREGGKEKTGCINIRSVCCIYPKRCVEAGYLPQMYTNGSPALDHFVKHHQFRPRVCSLHNETTCFKFLCGLFQQIQTVNNEIKFCYFVITRIIWSPFGFSCIGWIFCW